MSENESGWIDELLRTTLERQYPGFDVVPGAFPSIPRGLVGQVGFRTKSGGGSLGVVANAETLHSMAPTSDDQFDSSDWIGELANQTLGRIKLEVAGSMSAITSSTPIVLRGTCLRMECSDAVRTFAIQREGESLGIWIDLDAVQFGSEPDDEEADCFICAGECVLFL